MVYTVGSNSGGPVPRGRELLGARQPFASVARWLNMSTHSEQLKLQHQNLLKSLDQYGRMADTTAARPAALQRRMAAMKVEQDEEIEMLEDARRRAQ